MLLFNRYEYHPQTDLIGKGGFSRVYRALDKKLNRNVALKIYKLNELAEKYSPIAEIQRVIDFDHPNISRYIDIEEIQKEDAFGEIEKIQVCVMEYLDGGDLAQFHQTHNNLELFRQLLLDVLRGLAYLHQNEVIHRDIKPANILIKNTPRGPVAKITDFGISKRSDTSFNSSSSALIISIPYMAPEQLNAQKYGINENSSYNIDLWMLGVTVYEILTDDVLFKNSAQDASEQIMNNIMQPDIPAKVNQLPAPFRQLVQTCLVKDAKERVKKAEDLFELLQQPIVIPETITRTAAKEEAVEEVAGDLKATHVIAPQTIDAITEQPPVTDDIIVIATPPILQEEAATSADDTVILPVTPPVEQNEARSTDDTMIISRAPVVPQHHEPSDDDTRVLSSTFNNQPHVAGDETVLLGNAARLTAAQKMAASVPPPTLLPPQGNKEKPVNLFNRYDYYPIADCIGKGGFSRVYKAYDNKLSRWVALKIYKTGEFSDRYSPIAEIRRVVNLDHPNICRYLDMEEVENKNPFGENEIIQVCVMELLDSGNILEYYRKSQDTQLLAKLLRDVLNGLAYLHRHGIIHRDIKPANILIKSALEGPVAKITDFGISKATDNINSNSSSALVVSIPYMAPEQLNVKKYGINEKIASNLDLWSLGVTLYEIITGKVLFRNSDKDSSEQVMANIMSPQLPEKINELPEPFRKIVSLCVVKNARERVQKAETLLQVLDAATANTKTIANTATDNKPKGGLFFVEEKETTAMPFVDNSTTGSIRETTEPYSRPSRFTIGLQRAAAWWQQHTYKIMIGTCAVLLAVILLLSVRYFTRHNNNNTVPPGPTPPVVKQPAHNNAAAAQPPASPDTTSAAPAATTGKTEKPAPHDGERNKKKTTVNANKQEEQVITSNANEKCTVVITTAKRCSLKIESAENGTNEYLPSIQGSNTQLRLYPGKYKITAISQNDKSDSYTGYFIVRAGKSTSYAIPW
jgi:serine/threonine protein kinase